MKFFSSLVNTCFFIGKSSIAPGTLGSIFALLIWIFFLSSYESRMISLLLVTILSYFTISSDLNNSDEKDPQYIVVDEVVGMWISLLFVPLNDFRIIILAFGIFRLLDIFKPSIIARVQNIDGAIGVLIDDVLCGIITAIIIIGIVGL